MKLEVCDICGRTLHPHTKRDLAGALSVVMNAKNLCSECMEKVQAIDVAPVVRCKDCKHYQHDAFFDHDWCDGRRVTPDYYCADGERRSDG